MGNFDEDILTNEGTIYKNSKMIFDGQVLKGIKHGKAKEKFFIYLEKSEIRNIKPFKNCGYLEFRGEFKNGKRDGFGELFFEGDYNAFKEYFMEEKKNEELELRNWGIMDSEDENDFPLDIPLINKQIDSEFNVNDIFKKMPIMHFDSERKINHKTQKEINPFNESKNN